MDEPQTEPLSNDLVIAFRELILELAKALKDPARIHAGRVSSDPPPDSPAEPGRGSEQPPDGGPA